MTLSKVLLVAGSANFSTRDVWDGYRVGLAEAGIQVQPYPTFSLLKLLSADSVASDIIGNALDIENHIDCVIFVDGLYFRGRQARVPRTIRERGIPTVLVATDDPYESISNVESLYTYRFTNEVNCVTPAVAYLPTATLPVPEVPQNESPKYDVSFVGTAFEDRLELLGEISDYCERTQRRFLIAGKFPEGYAAFTGKTFTDVRAQTITEDEKWEIYWESRLTINLFRTSSTPCASPSPRVFEVTALGAAALLSGPKRNEVHRIYGDSIYHFHDAPSAIEAINHALDDEPGRRVMVRRAQQITEQSHFYGHRATDLVATVRQAEEQRLEKSNSQHRVAWIIGCGRTGSTWLSELLAEIRGIRRWHEPYFGRFFKHVAERPDELQRAGSFYHRRHHDCLLEGLRELFFNMVRQRFPQFGRHALVVKEVNAPEIYPWLNRLMPAGRLIHLMRDPFDTLDSYLDLQKPGSWNERFAESDRDPLSPEAVQRTCDHIAATMNSAMTAYESFHPKGKLCVRYEDLLEDPVPQLCACCDLLDVKVNTSDIEAAVEKHAFKNYEKSGTLEFRRKGQAGVWKESENFTSSVREIADTTLGPLRTRFGYL